MIYKIKKLSKKWYMQLLLIAVPFVLGLIGYIEYYNVTVISKHPERWPFWMPLYSTLKLFAFSFDAKPDGFTGNEWFIICLWAARILAVIPTGHVLFRLLWPIFKHYIAGLKYLIFRNRSEQLLIIGSNEENKMIYQSAKEKKIRPMILCGSEEEFSRLCDEGFNCIYQKEEPVIRSVCKGIFSSDTRNCTVIINTKDEEKNLLICGMIVDRVKERLSVDIEEINALRENMEPADRKELLEKEAKAVKLLNRIHAIVFGDQQYETAYQKMEQDSFGVLRYTNKARKTALDLIFNYPLAQFIDRSRYIDPYACIDKKLAINVIFVGFGETNQELFKSSTIINQFIEADEGEIPCPKKISYYIYDKKDIKTKNLNHQLFRFSQEFLYGLRNGIFREEDYLEIPPDPTEFTSGIIDVNDPGFYKQIWSYCSGNPDSLNVIFVAVGNDLENIDLAQKLMDKAMEWALPDTRIFVKIRKAENYRILNPDKHIIPFGCEKEIIYNIDKIFNNELEEMARKKHYMNALIRSGKGTGLKGTADEIETDSLYEWYTYDPVKKISSLYSILSLRSKLQMMGLDYRKKENNSIALKSNEAYFALYAKDSRPEIDPQFEKIYGKDIYCYPKILEKEDLKHQSLRQNLAIQEHYRWNAFMISQGFIPASREKIISDAKEHGKDYDLRVHGNLTTIEGLIEFRKITARPGRPEAKTDVLNYDFHLMDDIWWYLDMFGYEIFNR